MIGYMLTWRTYGTWLQGDKRGWFKDGHTYKGKRKLLEYNQQLLDGGPVQLNYEHKQIVRDEIIKTAMRMEQGVLAVAVYSNHVHLVLNNTGIAVGSVVKSYKRDATYALRAVGLTGKIWATGYDKRFCFDKKSLLERVEYVNRHVEE